MLVHKLGLDIKQFRISYHPGGSVKQITQGKYSFEGFIPVDPSIDFWYDLGFKPENFFVEVSRNTVQITSNTLVLGAIVMKSTISTMIKC